jgi:ligand-binding sensor domain-containing protein
MKNIISLSVVLILTITTYPQQQSNWQNYADMKSAKDIATTSIGVWVASQGGAYFFNTVDSSFDTYSKSSGINGTELTAIGIDTFDKVWFGSANGLIDVYNPQTNSFRAILDIFNSDKTSKKINDITISGDTVFVATDFGISLINSNNYLFYDTYFKFGSFTSNIKVNNILFSEIIYAATESGVAIQKPEATNLSAPESWNVYDQTSGLPTGGANVIIFYNSTLIAGTNSGLYSFDGNIWQPYSSLAGNKIIDLLVVGNSLNILTPTKGFTYDGITLSEIWTTDSQPVKLAYQDGAGLIVATKLGIFIDSNFVYPNGPAANQFPNMIVDKKDNLWSASGKDVSGVGLYKYDRTQWTIYNVAQYPDLYTNAFYSIFTSSDNSIYAGSWGQGFVKIKNNDITRYHAGNTEMLGVQGDLNFIVITGFAEDSKNNMWILNLNAADSKSLYMLTPDSVWYSFRNPLEQHSSFSEVENLVIDQYGTKWYTMGNEGSLGLFYYNEKGTYTDPTDDAYGYLNTSKGLTSNAIYSLAIDRRGDLWVGTSLGVNIITNLNTVLSSANPQLRITNSFSVRQQTVNALVVDPLNQKWLGTNQGLFLLSTDGTQLLATLDTKNSPLLSDQIESLAIDENTGTVYVGSAAGLTSFDTPSILPVESFNGLTIYPNPIVITDGSKLVTIDGLIRNTDIKIVSVSGKLVREFSSPGGRTAFWDGRDNDGNLVSSGVYIIIAFDQEGNSVETGKIAVLRE